MSGLGIGYHAAEMLWLNGCFAMALVFLAVGMRAVGRGSDRILEQPGLRLLTLSFAAMRGACATGVESDVWRGSG